MTSQECNQFSCELALDGGAQLFSQLETATPSDTRNVDARKTVVQVTSVNNAQTVLHSTQVTPAAVFHTTQTKIVKKNKRLENVSKAKVMDIFNKPNIVQRSGGRNATREPSTSLTATISRTSMTPTASMQMTVPTPTLAVSFYMWIPLFWGKVGRNYLSEKMYGCSLAC